MSMLRALPEERAKARTRVGDYGPKDKKVEIEKGDGDQLSGGKNTGNQNSRSIHFGD
jgi:hypothetical protein